MNTDNQTSNKILTLKELIEVRKEWKDKKEKVVFTNGCFDILHLGHIDYLEKSSKMGDKMIIGLNTDLSVKKLKGEQRPINPEYARARILAALAFTDAIVLFGEETPKELISSILPDVLVKGNDYSIEDIVGAKEVMEAGGEVKTISLVDGYSTTNIINSLTS